MPMQNILLLMAGGALGTLSRFLLSSITNRVFMNSFPIGTLLVNASGSFLIGLLWGLFDAGQLSTSMRLFLFVGILGGFTTFSALSLETLQLIKNGSMGMAAFNIIANNLLGIGLVFLGFFLAQGLRESIRF